MVRLASRINKRSLRYPLWLLRDRKDLVGCEIGVMYGVHARQILKKLDMKKLYLIEPIMKLKAYERTFYKCVDWIPTLSRLAYHQLRYQSLDFVYIDGDHSYDAVKKDLQIYYYRVKHGGMVAGHDFNHQDVARAVTEFCARHKLKLHTYGFPTDWWFIR
jgi:predicted O-methyltransferase YrrM